MQMPVASAFATIIFAGGAIVSNALPVPCGFSGGQRDETCKAGSPDTDSDVLLQSALRIDNQVGADTDEKHANEGADSSVDRERGGSIAHLQESETDGETGRSTTFEGQDKKNVDGKRHRENEKETEVSLMDKESTKRHQIDLFRGSLHEVNHVPSRVSTLNESLTGKGSATLKNIGIPMIHVGAAFLVAGVLACTLFFFLDAAERSEACHASVRGSSSEGSRSPAT